MLLITLLLCLFARADDIPTNLQCTTALPIIVQQSYIYHHKIDNNLQTSIVELTGEDGTKSKETVRGLYFMLNEIEDVSLYVSTCGARTTVETEIYIFSDCNNDIASGITKISKSDVTCSSTGKSASFFDLKANTTMYVLVKVVGNGSGSLATSFVKVNNLPNYYCEQALEIQSIPYSDISDSTVNYPTGDVKCLSQSMPAKWYHMKGTGKYYLVDTCSSLTQIDTYLVLVDSVNAGDTCKQAECTKYNDNGCGKGSTGSTLLFKSEEGKDYHIGVFGKNGANGRFQVNVQTVDDTLPFNCENAVSISLPFTRAQNVPSAWPLTPVISEGGAQYPVFYLSIIGTDNDVVFSTCKTQSKVSGTGIELIQGCTSTTVLEPIYSGSCNKDEYKVFHLDAGVKYIAKFYAKESDSQIIMNVQLKGQNHYQCIDALSLTESYTDTIPLKQLKQSLHGCDGIEEYHQGAWYQLKKSASSSVEHYRIGASTLSGDIVNIGIEQQLTCDSSQCVSRETNTAQMDIFLNDEIRYVFVYGTGGQETLSVGIVKFDNIAHSVCTAPKIISLPFTTVGFIDTTQSNTLKCIMTQYPSFWYSIQLSESLDVIATTVSSDTKVDTYLEVLTGCYGDENVNCIAYNDNLDNSADTSSRLTFSAYSRTVYNIAVAQKERTARAHRFSIYPTQAPAGSMCETSNYLDTVEAQQTIYVHTAYAYETKVSGKTLKGSYFRFNTHVSLQLTIRTCSTGTEINNVIAIFKSCNTQKDKDGKYVSIPDIMVAGTNSSKRACGTYGAELSYQTQPDTNYYLFIASLEHGYDGMIEAEVILEEKSQNPPTPPPEDSSAEDNDDNNNEQHHGISGWGVWGILLYAVYFVIIIVALIIIIIIYKKKNSSSSSFSSF
ncbi:hypothetical protein EHI8A_165280 [Entamoeba histolytica HM-1:IMSS-B]|uniref:Uncharacterized protein n=6 Tax=Entamoeba histolytica TaxID=5759 RepID=C4MAH5_ENTH1|nr:hypothetical protein EHI_191730 [Entamoeba histolytica HM-1:IMSS]EMD49592.1 Hypothetical protein EHI5A_014230 [Entamoeba histolytica KU27]EMH76237.1 hypothetical protein EHI8A_165280 [Entamoeba histolytica HM-1:IMSS-B]EMS11685.1 hypothetical protein KM1_225480 [Entamoeba histolytica HM-3:IMSS]ENY62539.1 hypothetical protein EHI7A_146260 [Entamoeba histolytica HM-1:IMSS-A]BAJ53823.1 cysteine protease binding protein family 10 [Entamoeba histolytica]|eukprot:XP_649015.1 hypothetical protein EHI_191730 [Entamoeba histolytica HM-1:IMSS]